MRTAILSDIHGNYVAFEAVLQHMATQNINSVVFLGDLAAKGPQPQACYDAMKALKPVVWVKGNTEAWLDDALIDLIPNNPESIRLIEQYEYMSHNLSGQAMDDLISKPLKQHTNFGHFEALCTHGSLKGHDEVIDPFEDKAVLKDILDGVRSPLILCGHYHKQFNEVYQSYRIINPGSVGFGSSKEDTRAHYAIMDTARGFHIDFYQVEYDKEALLNKAKAMNFVGLDAYQKYFNG